MKKVVLKLNLYGEKQKQKAMKIASAFEGVRSLSIADDMKLTVVGDIDPANLTLKMRKLCCVDVVSVGPANEEKKNEVHPPTPYHRFQTDYDRTTEENPNACIVL